MLCGDMLKLGKSSIFPSCLSVNSESEVLPLNCASFSVHFTFSVPERQTSPVLVIVLLTQTLRSLCEVQRLQEVHTSDLWKLVIDGTGFGHLTTADSL